MSTATDGKGHRFSVAQEPVTSILKGGDIPINDSGTEWTADEEVLAALGYKPEFKREFTLWTTFCVSFAVLGLLPSFATTLWYGMGYAGTAGMTWGWLVAMVSTPSIPSGTVSLCSCNRIDPTNQSMLDRNPKCRLFHGRTVLLHAYIRRPVLRSRRPRSSRLGTFGSLGHRLE